MPEDDVIDSAVEEAIAEANGDVVPDNTDVPPDAEQATSEEQTSEEPTTEEAQEETSAEESGKTEEEPAADEEEPLGLSAEQLAKINESPELQAAYKSLQGAATKKFQSAADLRKEADQAVKIFEHMRTNPEQALKEYAEALGHKVVPADTKKAETEGQAADAATDAVDSLVEKYGKELGPESAKLLVPMMKEVARLTAENLISPISEQTMSLQEQAEMKAISASVAEFGAEIQQKGGIWDNSTQESMAEMMDRFPMTHGEDGKPTVPMKEYLGYVHDLVTVKQNKASSTKREVQRLKKATEASEPTRAVRPTPEPDPDVSSMSERDAIAYVTALAEKEARG